LILITYFRLIWQQATFCLMPNLSENCIYNQNLVSFLAIQKRFLYMQTLTIMKDPEFVFIEQSFFYNTENVKYWL